MSGWSGFNCSTFHDTVFAEISIFSMSWSLISCPQESWHAFCYSIVHHQDIKERRADMKEIRIRGNCKIREGGLRMQGIDTKRVFIIEAEKEESLS